MNELVDFHYIIPISDQREYTIEISILEQTLEESRVVSSKRTENVLVIGKEGISHQPTLLKKTLHNYIDLIVEVYGEKEERVMDIGIALNKQYTS